MDLSECRQRQGLRHPWELARMDAVRAILAPHLHEGIRILDLGCGDGFVARSISTEIGGGGVTAVDINFTDERISEFGKLGAAVRYLNEPPAEEEFDLLLIMDVLEHVKDDAAFLGCSVERHVASGGKVMITVPSFQFLFGHHDVVLGHYRRYHLREAEEVAESSGLTVMDSGYLFGSLLLPKLCYNLLSAAGSSSVGIGNWGGAGLTTAIIRKALNLDNAFLRSAARLGIKLPGLSAWLLCQK